MITPPAFVKLETWDEFVEMRRSMPRTVPFTDAAAKRIIMKLVAFNTDGWDVDYILGTAIECGYRSVFLPKDCPRTRPIRAEQPHEEKPTIVDPVKHAQVMEKVRQLGSKLRAA